MLGQFLITFKVLKFTFNFSNTVNYYWRNIKQAYLSYFNLCQSQHNLKYYENNKSDQQHISHHFSEQHLYKNIHIWFDTFSHNFNITDSCLLYIRQLETILDCADFQVIRSDDYLGHCRNFIFLLWNQLWVSLAAFSIIVLLKCPRSSSSMSWQMAAYFFYQDCLRVMVLGPLSQRF